MRIYLFILLAILVTSCSTTKEYDCDYSDYKTISLEDFEWVKEVDIGGTIAMKGDSVFYSYTEIDQKYGAFKSNICRIDVSNGNFIDSFPTQDRANLYHVNYPFDEVPYGIKYFINPSLYSFGNPLSILFYIFNNSNSQNNEQKIILEIIGFYKNKPRKWEEFKFRLEKDRILDMNDFALFKGYYLVLSFEVIKESKYKPVNCIGLLDLQKLIDKY